MSMKKLGGLTLSDGIELRKKPIEDSPDDESMKLSVLQWHIEDGLTSLFQ